MCPYDIRPAEALTPISRRFYPIGPTKNRKHGLGVQRLALPLQVDLHASGLADAGWQTASPGMYLRSRHRRDRSGTANSLEIVNRK